MKNSLLSTLVVFGLTTLTACTNSTNELNTHFEQLQAANVQIGVLDLFQRNDVRRQLDMEVEMALYEKCAAFFSSNPDLNSLKDSLVYEELLKLSVGDTDALLGPFLRFTESQNRYNLSDTAQSLIWSTPQEKEVAFRFLNQYRGSPEFVEARSYILTNQDSPKFKPLGICMAQEMFVTLFGEETGSTEALHSISEIIITEETS